MAELVTDLDDLDLISEAWVDGVRAAVASLAPCGRLTLTSGVPVTTADVTAAGTLYYTPYRGELVAVNVAGVWVPHELEQISLALSGITSGLPYEIFLYSNAGVLTLERLAWSTISARATALEWQNGRLTKVGDTSRLYLGTIHASASGVCEDSAGKRFVWNMYNRVARDMYATEATVSWTYTTTNTLRASNGTSAQRLQFVVGVAEDAVAANTTSFFYANPGTSVPQVAIGLDSTTAAHRAATGWSVGNTYHGGAGATFNATPTAGFHYLQALETCRVGGGTITWYGSGGVGESGKIQGSLRG